MDSFTESFALCGSGEGKELVTHPGFHTRGRLRILVSHQVETQDLGFPVLTSQKGVNIVARMARRYGDVSSCEGMKREAPLRSTTPPRGVHFVSLAWRTAPFSVTEGNRKSPGESSAGGVGGVRGGERGCIKSPKGLLLHYGALIASSSFSITPGSLMVCD